MNTAFSQLPFTPADILLPKQGSDFTKWSVVACDQYTSQPEYWQEVEKFVGEAPSSLRLILPESKLEGPGVSEAIQQVNAAMERYLNKGVFEAYPNALIYVERRMRDGKVRRGLVGKIDLSAYDFTPGSGSLVRATEGTVLSRIPPRVAVREHAVLELPHVLLLADDPEKTVIEPLADRKDAMRQVYDFDLMMDSGHLAGWLLGEEEQQMVAERLLALTDPAAFAEKYHAPDAPVLLFAVGDGNHSLATAKACWEKSGGEQARYALVELTNLHDDALEFEPIHRVVFDTDPVHLLSALKQRYAGAYEGRGGGHVLKYVTEQGSGAVTVPIPEAQLAVGTLQRFLDEYLGQNPGRVDYIHGDEVAASLAARPGAIGFLLPPMDKSQLFPTVIFDGVLPRKTFSMGHAHDKRFYLEGRCI